MLVSLKTSISISQLLNRCGLYLKSCDDVFLLINVVDVACLCVFLPVFRDVSSVELLMNNHQGIKAEIDARNDSFTACIELGKALLARKHYASEEVKTKR